MPGEILGMRFVMAIVDLLLFDFYMKLSVLVCWHQIDIRLINGADTTWFGAGWQQSIPERLILDTDYFLGPFKVLSNMGSLKKTSAGRAGDSSICDRLDQRS